MSWTRHITHPGELLKKGDEVEAIVLDVDADQQRIALGIKQTQDDPWDDIDRKFHIGDIVSGKVSKIANFGAFIELADEIDGLVHISQISEERVEKIKDVLKLGQDVSARVIKIDKDERRIGLSIKAANYDPAQLQAEINAYERVRGPVSERNSAPASMSTSTGSQDFANLGDILDNL